MIKKFIDIHSHKKNNNPDVMQILNDDTYLFQSFNLDNSSFYCSGYHPYLCNKNIDHQKVEKHIQCFSAKLVGIGEIGLDRSLKVDFDLQENVFLKFLMLAQVKALPVFLHCVRAYSDIVKLLRKTQFDHPVIFHDFRGNTQELEQLLKTKFNFYFSLSPAFLKKKDNHSIFKSLPKEKTFFESDDSQMSIEEIYQDFSNYFQMNVEELIYQHDKNFNLLFPSLNF